MALPLGLAALAAAGASIPLLPGFPKGKRDVSDDLPQILWSREPENELEARILPLLPLITAGLAGAASLTPLIPALVGKGKREPSPEPQPLLPPELVGCGHVNGCGPRPWSPPGVFRG